jgi:hypothetical protein
MKFPTWGQLKELHCANRKINTEENVHYEDLATRRYNYSPQEDKNSCRLVFLKPVLEDPANKTLRRNGRFVWCKDLKYEGRNDSGLRQISFSVDAGKKRFTVAENNVLCIPSKSYVNNNRFFKQRLKTFIPFSTVFGYKNTMNMMIKNSDLEEHQFREIIEKESPFKPGTLVAPRLGYFYPNPDARSLQHLPHRDEQHPCGIILGNSFIDNYLGRELYRVRFGETTYEKIHPVQMEIINEV